MRRLGSAFVILCMMLSATACQRETKIRQKVLGYLSDTEKVSRAFSYVEEAGGKKVEVAGNIEDYYRFHETVSIDGAPVLEQVVDDDVLAVRVIDAARIPVFSAGVLPGGSQTLANALRSGQWVTDPSGAPPLFKAAATEELTGTDPLRDAVDVIDYARVAIEQASDVKEFQKNDLLPAYREFEDHFPEPDQKIGERRFDLIRPLLPRPQSGPGGGGGAANVARTSTFRKMAIYVRVNKVTRIFEEIDVEGHHEFVEAREEGKSRVLEQLQNIKEGRNQERIRPRIMSVVFTDLGQPQGVRKPDGALAANLKPIINSSAGRPEGIFGTGGGGYGPTAASSP